MTPSRHHCFAAAAALTGLGLATGVRAASCVDALQIDAPAAVSAALSQRLGRGELSALPERSCRRARVRLARSDHGLSVALEQGAQRAARDVPSLEAAAFWLESWLSPELYLPPPSPVAATSVADDGPELPARSLPEPSLTGRVGVGARASLDDDAARWLGASLFGDLDVGGPFWLGAALGRSWDPLLGDSALGAGISRRTTRVVLRGGGRWALIGGSDLRVGMGLGMLSAVASGPPIEGSGRVEDDEAIGLLELTTELTFPLGSWQLLAGLELERSVDLESVNPRQPDEPLARVYPNWRGGLSFGLALPLGGAAREATP